METQVELICAMYIYEITDETQRMCLDSVYDVAQYLLSDEVIRPIVVKKIPVHRVEKKVNDEPTS